MNSGCFRQLVILDFNFIPYAVTVDVNEMCDAIQVADIPYKTVRVHKFGHFTMKLTNEICLELPLYLWSGSFYSGNCTAIAHSCMTLNKYFIFPFAAIDFLSVRIANNTANWQS